MATLLLLIIKLQLCLIWLCVGGQNVAISGQQACAREALLLPPVMGEEKSKRVHVPRLPDTVRRTLFKLTAKICSTSLRVAILICDIGQVTLMNSLETLMPKKKLE